MPPCPFAAVRFMDIRSHLASLLIQPLTSLGVEATASDVASLLTEPRDRSLGDLALPTFKLAAQVKTAPPVFCAKLAELLQPVIASDAFLSGVVATGPFLNFRQDSGARAMVLLRALASGTWGTSTEGAGKTVGLDYSSPNIAKPFGIGHLRSTAIGRALANIYSARGYRCVGVNHLGDWGTQFGKLMAAFEAWGDEAKLEATPILHLYELYVEFHKRSADDSSWEDLGRDWFRRLELGDEKATAYWTRFRDLSLREFQRIYDRLGVSFDHFWGEAYYNNMLDDVIRDVEKSGLAVESEGALVVPLDDLDMPPCLIRKSDGATLYATRDLAAARYRYEQLQFDRFLYVVGTAQAVHFRQVFTVLERMGYEWASRCIHVPFGLIQGISTRKGTLVFLDDILDKGRDLARAILAEREGLTEHEKDVIAEQVAIGAIVFQDLSRDRIKDYDFDWDQMLRGLRPGEPGRTGPYLQYTHVRLGSLLDNYREKVGALPEPDEINPALLQESETVALMAMLEKFPAAVEQAARDYEPAVISRYILDLAESFNAFYTQHKVITDDLALSQARILLVSGTRAVMGKGMTLLGIPQPSRM